MYLTPEKIKKVISKGYDINTFISDRAGRKSSTVQEWLIEEAENGRPFILLRNKKDEEINENWLSEYVVDKFNDYVFFTEKVNSNIVALKFRKYDNTVYLLCYGLYVSIQQKYKSSYYEGFEKVEYIVWEECIPNVPLVQNINHIRTRCMTEVNNVLSIGSTVARGRRIQYIWLGNDIKENILNPVTVCFNLLERLEADEPIMDTAVFLDKEYTFYFEYFSFPDSIEHWLINEGLHITRYLADSFIDFTKVLKYDIILKTAFKDYYLYNCGNFFHISDINYIDSNTISAGIENPLAFFRKFGAEHLYLQYDLRTALTMLCTFYGVSSRIIKNYFGDRWVKEPQFSADEYPDKTRYIDLEKITSMSLSEIINLPVYNDLVSLNEIRKQQALTFSNIKIQMLIEELHSIMLFI